MTSASLAVSAESPGRARATRRLEHRRLVLIAAVALSLGATLGVFAAFHAAFPFDRPLLLAVQDLGGWFEPIATYCNRIQHDYVLPAAWLATVGALAWRRRFDMAILFALIALGPVLNEAAVKEAVGRPRPVGEFVAEHPGSLSFPSGHALTATMFLGLWVAVAAEVLPRRLVVPVRAAAITLILLTALSRVWTGAHWPSDVLGGMVLGTGYVAVTILAHRQISPHAATLLRRR